MSDLLKQISLYLQDHGEQDQDYMDPFGEQVELPIESNTGLSLDAENLDVLDVLDLLQIGDQKIEQLEHILAQTIGGLESRKRRILKLLSLLRSRYNQKQDNSIDFQDHRDNKSLNQENRNNVRRRAKALASQSGLDLSRAALHTILSWEVAAGRQIPSDLNTKARLWHRQGQASQPNIHQLNKQKNRAIKYFKNNLE